MDKKQIEHLNAVYLEWLDPHSVDAWSELDEISMEPFIVRTFGILIKESEHALAIALNISVGNQASCTMIIPKDAIKVRFEGKIHMKKVRT